MAPTVNPFVGDDYYDEYPMQRVPFFFPIRMQAFIDSMPKENVMSESLKKVSVTIDGKVQEYVETKPGVLELVKPPEPKVYPMTPVLYHGTTTTGPDVLADSIFQRHRSSATVNPPHLSYEQFDALVKLVGGTKSVTVAEKCAKAFGIGPDVLNPGGSVYSELDRIRGRACGSKCPILIESPRPETAKYTPEQRERAAKAVVTYFTGHSSDQTYRMYAAWEKFLVTMREITGKHDVYRPEVLFAEVMGVGEER